MEQSITCLPESKSILSMIFLWFVLSARMLGGGERCLRQDSRSTCRCLSDVHSPWEHLADRRDAKPWCACANSGWANV